MNVSTGAEMLGEEEHLQAVAGEFVFGDAADGFTKA